PSLRPRPSRPPRFPYTTLFRSIFASSAPMDESLGVLVLGPGSAARWSTMEPALELLDSASDVVERHDEGAQRSCSGPTRRLTSGSPWPIRLELTAALGSTPAHDLAPPECGGSASCPFSDRCRDRARGAAEARRPQTACPRGGSSGATA